MGDRLPKSAQSRPGKPKTKGETSRKPMEKKAEGKGKKPKPK
jgi:hypothetical protein